MATAAATATAAAAGATAQTSGDRAPTTAEIVASHRLPIARAGTDRFSGPGWDRLLAEARAAQFTMIGEQHATADLADFETAMFRAIAPMGYTHAALEVGPYSTEFAEALVRSGKGALGRYIAAPGHGFTLPFLFFAEEAAMAEEIVARSPDGQRALWGLDQEFVGAIPILAELLRRRATSDAQRSAAAALADRARSEAMLLPKLAAAELDGLSAAFRGNAPAEQIIAAMRLSHGIYQPFFGRGAVQPANLARETYLKDNFLRRFTEAERRRGAPPKVFLKFGGYHAMRGMSGTDVPALGNFLAEWGHARGFGLLNVMADCAGGEALDPRTGRPAPCASYLGNDSLLARLTRDGDAVSMIDLKALRARLGAMKDLDAMSRQAILAFDYYVAFKDVRPATPLGGPLPTP